MNTNDFDYNLPTELIAQHSIEPRDHSKMMVLDRAKQEITHKHFFDIVDYFKSGDVLVWNNSKVFKARLFGRLEAEEHDIDHDNIPDKPLLNQQEVEIFLVREMENEGVWKVLAKPGRRVKLGMRIRFAPDFYADVMVKEKGGDILIQFPLTAEEVRNKANQYGHIPIPPYVKDEPDQIEMYQTVYAHEEKEGSVAAPTAGFHFTPAIIEALKKKGVICTEVTLHVGLGTFLPVKSENIEEHQMHSEWVEVGQECVDIINNAKQEGRRVIAVGTTTVRTLEGVNCQLSKVNCYKGDIDIFITPGFPFQVIDAMITNFHLPKSTLLMLVSAFVGDREFALECYKSAVDNNYRFFSFGDAMLIM